MKYVTTAILAAGAAYTVKYWLLLGSPHNQEVGQSLILIAGVLHLIWGDKKLF